MKQMNLLDRGKDFFSLLWVQCLLIFLGGVLVLKIEGSNGHGKGLLAIVGTVLCYTGIGWYVIGSLLKQWIERHKK